MVSRLLTAMRHITTGALVAGLLVVGLVGAFGGVAGAMEFDRTDADTNETALDSENRSSAATNDTLAEIGIGMGLESVDGGLEIDCTGELLTGHDCQKAGVLDLGVVAIDYDGAMGGPIAELGYWFDDHIVVYVAGLEAQLEFSCDMGLDDVTCPVRPSLSFPDVGDLRGAEGISIVDPENVSGLGPADALALQPDGVESRTGAGGESPSLGSLLDAGGEGADADAGE